MGRRWQNGESLGVWNETQKNKKIENFRFFRKREKRKQQTRMINKVPNGRPDTQHNDTQHNDTQHNDIQA